MREFVLASSNEGKIKEFEAILSSEPIKLHSQASFGITPIEETGLSFVENAILKARHASRLSGLPAIADDSGLIIDALNGAPGVYSARYAGENTTMAEKMTALLNELKSVPESKRQARFCAVIVTMQHSLDPNPLIFQGFWEGMILSEPRGMQGFGYDPILWIPEFACSVAELSPYIKNQYSHRAQALRLLRDYYAQHA